MSRTDGPNDQRDTGEKREAIAARISAYTSSPERTVFTESGNPDGWIATDTTVRSEP